MMMISEIQAQPATTAKTFRMYNDATHSVSITAGAALGTGTFTWPQPAVGFFKSDGTGAMSLTAVDLSTSDVTNTLGISNGGTGTTTVGPAGSIAYSDGSKIAYTLAGTSGQLLVSGGGGSPTWTSTFPTGITVPFDQISSGSNVTATMTVGTGASLAPVNNGTITANRFVGSGSTTNAVDLGTAEVNGTLGVANGGTGNTVVGAAGSVAYSDGGKIVYSSVGTSGQVLTSGGGGSPTWTTGVLAKAAGRVQGDNTNFSYTITPPGASGYSATSTINITIESATNQSATVTSRTATNFTVQTPVILTTTDFIDWTIY
jgi:hypothetical protein